MNDPILINCQRELINGYTKKKHPFRYFTLATCQNQNVRQRTVVLRKLLNDFELVFFTDTRSQKVADIQENPQVSGLFYHPKKLLQLQIVGKAEFITDPEQLQQFWSMVGEHAKKDYTTELAPGSSIQHPDQIHYNFEAPHFCPMKIVPRQIEYLQLQRPNHLRMLFTKEEGEWSSQFLTP